MSTDLTTRPKYLASISRELLTELQALPYRKGEIVLSTAGGPGIAVLVECAYVKRTAEGHKVLRTISGRDPMFVTFVVPITDQEHIS